MKAIAGSVVILAGSVLLAFGTLADGILSASNRSGSPGAFAEVVGSIVGLIGFGILMVSMVDSGAAGRSKQLPPEGP